MLLPSLTVPSLLSSIIFFLYLQALMLNFLFYQSEINLFILVILQILLVLVMDESLLSNNINQSGNYKPRYRFVIILVILGRKPTGNSSSDSKCFSNFLQLMCSAIGLMIFLPITLAFDLTMLAAGASLTLISFVLGSWGEIALAIFGIVREQETGDTSYYLTFIFLMLPVCVLIASCIRGNMLPIYFCIIPHYRVGPLRVVLNHFMHATLSLLLEDWNGFQIPKKYEDDQGI